MGEGAAASREDTPSMPMRLVLWRVSVWPLHFTFARSFQHDDTPDDLFPLSNYTFMAAENLNYTASRRRDSSVTSIRRQRDYPHARAHRSPPAAIPPQLDAQHIMPRLI